jgi:uncharacterized protein YoxC
MYLEIMVVVLSLVFLLLMGLLIPLLVQIRRTAKSINATLNMLNERLPGILKNLEEITANINSASYTVNSQINNLSYVVGRVQATLEPLLGLREFFGEGLQPPFLKAITTATALLKAVRAFFDSLRSSR